MKLYYPITIDLYKVYPLKRIDAQQGNIGRGVLVSLTAAGQVVELDGETVTLWARKPDKTVSYLPCMIVDGKIQVLFTNQMLALPGDVKVELQLIHGADNITTPIFTVEVHRSNVDSSAVESRDEFTALQAAINSVNIALEDVEELKKTGLKGDKGDQGEAATIQVGTVTAGEPGTAPEVNNSGTASAAVFNFVLPRGGQGPPGKDGEEQVFFGAYTDFPEEGDAAMLYVDTSNTDILLLYRWNGLGYVEASGKSEDKVVSDAFSETVAYGVGDYCIYNGALYKFVMAKAPGTWDVAAAEPTIVTKEFQALNANIAYWIENGFLPDPSKPEIILYNYGDQRTPVTGGWSPSKSGSGVCVTGSDYLQCGTTKGASTAIWGTINEIDLTGQTKFKIVHTFSRSGAYANSVTLNVYIDDTAIKQINPSASQKEDSIDISEYTGLHKVRVGLKTGGNADGVGFNGTARVHSVRISQ